MKDAFSSMTRPTRPDDRSRVRLFPDYVAFRAQSVNCRCGWRGVGRLAEPGCLFDIGVEVKCPCCTMRLGVAIFAPSAREDAAPKNDARRRKGQPGALAGMLDLFDSMTPDEHARAHALLNSGLELTRENWIVSFFSGYDSETLPAALEGHLPAAFAVHSA